MDHPFLIGERIYLRALEKADFAGPYLNWVNDPEVTKYLSGGRFPTTLEQLEEYFEKMTGSNEHVFFAIIDKETNKHVGNIKLGPIDWISRHTNFGTMIGEKDFWGKGYGTEAMQLILHYAFDRLNLLKVWDGAISVNSLSLRKNEKAGLKVEAVLKDHTYIDGRYYDSVIVSITQEEYYAMRGSRADIGGTNSDGPSETAQQNNVDKSSAS